MLFQKTIASISFQQWLWKDKENRRVMAGALLAMIIAFVWLKGLYPYPNFMPPDSYSYLEAAYNKDFINMWAIGYSLFLRWVGFFSHSHVVLVIVQYVLLQVAVLYFLFSIRYLLSPGKWLFRIIVAATAVNPLLPHIANFVSSDSLFTTLSLVWFTQLLWIIYQPNKRLFLLHSIVLVLAFMVRYNALYYPFISMALILFTQMPQRTKWTGIAAIILLLLAFIGRSQYEYKIKTGKVQYTAFGGWQLAANALYGYAHAPLDSSAFVPARFKDLHELTNAHMKWIRRIPTFLRPDSKIGVYYLWNFNSPLRLYMDKRYAGDSSVPFFKQWASMAPIYTDYGRYLITKHPMSFTRHYLWPNLQRYYAPPTLFMGSYNLGNAKADAIAVTWFGWKNNKLTTRTGDKKIKITEPFTFISPIVNLVLIAGWLCFAGLAGYKQSSGNSKKMIGCMLVVWISNTVFIVLAAPIELRYLLFPFVISLVWGALFVGFIMESIHAATKSEKTTAEVLQAKPAL